MKHVLLTASLLVLAGCQSANMSTVDAAESSFDVAAMDNLLSGAVESGSVIGVSALVYDEGQIVYENSFGLRDRERAQPVELDTVFRIYSMTKPITSALIMDLEEEGKLKLDDPVSKYIPELANMKTVRLDETGAVVFEGQSSPMTIEDLLLHRAGLGYGIYGPINPVEVEYEKAGLFDPTEDLSVKMQKLSQLPLVVQPGEGWYYSYSIDVLGRIAEVATGEKLSDLLQSRFFDPLEMTETGFHVRPDQKSRFASNYAQLEDGSYALQDDGQTSPYLSVPAFESGGGGLVSTLGDYSNFARMLLQNGEFKDQRILEADTVRLMMSDQMEPDDKFMMEWLGEQDNTGFGYGGRVITQHTEKTFVEDGYLTGDFGWGGMAKTNFFVLPDQNAYAIIMLQYFDEQEAALHTPFRKLVVSQVR